jgi:hypothetical protein
MVNIISISDLYEIRNRKKLELEYYRDQLEKLQNQMVLMEKDIDLTTIILNIIEHEKIKVIGIENKIDSPDNK